MTTPLPPTPPTATLLTVIKNPRNGVGISSLSVALAQMYHAQVIVLRVYQSYTRYRKYQSDISGDPTVVTVVESIRAAGVSARAMAAPGDDLGRAVRGASRQVRASAVLITWDLTGTVDGQQTRTDLDALLEDPSSDLYILDGKVSEPLRKILVPISKNPNTRLALHTSLALANTSNGQVTAFHMIDLDNSLSGENKYDEAGKTYPSGVIQGQGMDTRLSKAREDLTRDFGELAKHPRLRMKFSFGQEPAAEIVREFEDPPTEQEPDAPASRYDAVILGASHESIIDPALLGGIPAEVARSLQLPVLIVKRKAKPVSGRLITAWRWIYELLPKVTYRESEEVVEAVERAAYPRIDFFIMSGLAAVIATLGLLMNSPAVVIGAMLVEPLLATITGVGLGIVEGDTRLLRNSLLASFRGLLIAVVIGFFLTLIVPDARASDEVLRYARPTLFDLGIAMASGMAGAYAVARKELSAALPGVAISVSLVPPLSALGIGLALGDLTIIFGSSLTFVTNFLAIVVMGSLVFLLLGFGPNTGRSTEHQTTRRGLVWEALLSIALVVVLGLLTAQLLSESYLSNTIKTAVEELVRTELNSEVIDQTYTISEDARKTIILDVAIRSSRPVEYEEATALQEEIASQLERQVALRLSVVQATLLVPVPPPKPTSAP